MRLDAESGLYLPVDKKNTTNSLTREAMELVLGSLKDEDVEESLGKVVQSEFSNNRMYNVFVDAVTSQVINADQIDEDGMNPFNLLSEVLVLNHPDLWEDFLSSAEKRNPGLESMLRGAFYNSPRENFYQDASQEIMKANMGLFGRSIVFISMASMYGEDYPYMIEDDAKRSTGGNASSTQSQLDSRYLAGWEIAQQFHTPAVSPDEVVTRLTYLFTPDLRNPQEVPALKALRGQKAFTSNYPGESMPIVMCPARDTTRSLFTAYGRLLHQPAYHDKVVEKILS